MRHKKIAVLLTPAEFNDLKEFCQRHPNIAPTPAKALKHFAGLKLYRQIKQTTDPKRRGSPTTYQEFGIPRVIPCIAAEFLAQSKHGYGPNGLFRMIFSGLRK